MLFIILVISWYVSLGLKNVVDSISTNLLYSNKNFQQGMWLILVNSIKGFTASYTIWFVYYIVSKYPYPFF